MSYILPQVEVFQIFRQLPQNVIKNLNAFIFGPHYQLFRYSVAAEKELISLGAYVTDDDTVYAWPNQPTSTVVDTDYVKLYAENVWAEYASIPADAEHEAQIVSEDERNKVRIAALVLQEANDHLRSAELLRDVRVGDRVRYSYTDIYDETHTGTTKVVALEADVDAADIGSPTNKDANQADVTATAGLTAGSTAAFASTVGNTGAYASSKVFAMVSSLDDEFTGSLSAGVVEDVITVEVTTGGAPGTALATVSYASEMYARENVRIEAAGSEEGQIYLGNNLYLEFITAAAETEFSVGDTYTVTVAASFTELTASEFNATVSTYTGPKDTTYVIEVVRGGLFDRTVTQMPGLTNDSGSTLAINPGDSATPDWTEWLGGDVDDEYILRCTGAGDITTATFSLTSGLGDDVSGIVFATAETDIALGNRGLVGSLTAATFTVGDYWVIRVNACRPQVKVTDTAGIDATVYVTVADGTEFDLGDYGAELNFNVNSNTEAGVDASGGLRKGDIYYVEASGEVEQAVHTLVLADDLDASIPAGDNIALWLYTIQNGVAITSKRVQSPPDYNWEADADDGLTVYEGLQVQDASWIDVNGDYPWLDVYSADLYVEYRALLTTNADTIHSITDVSDVATTLGTIHPDNPLAQGVYNALLNSGNRAIYYMGLPSNDTAGWSAILDRATLSDDVYAFVPLTQDTEVFELVAAHVNEMSTETEKHWRILFVGSAMPSADPIYTQVAHPLGDQFLATISDDDDTDYPGNTLLKFVDEDGDPTTFTEALSDLKAGDKIRINFSTDAWGTAEYAEYEVAEVLTNTTVRLESGPAAVVDLPTKVEAWHPYTLAEMADAYAAISSGFASRRIYNIFPSQLGSGGVVQSGEFGAAAVAGLASSVPPQQPITNIELNGFDDLPLVYQTFNRTQLNKMAEYGTLIIMQDIVGGRIYIRHQVSTKALGGNLNETELSITKNLDSISYYFAARYAPYIGKYNITPAMLNVIELVLRDGLNYLGSLTDVGLLGPQVILEETEIVGVQQDTELADHIIATVNLGLPKPFNVLQLRLVV